MSSSKGRPERRAKRRYSAVRPSGVARSILAYSNPVLCGGLAKREEVKPGLFGIDRVTRLLVSQYNFQMEISRGPPARSIALRLFFRTTRAGGDKATKVQHQPNYFLPVDGALTTYYDHLNRTSWLLLSQQEFHDIHAGSDNDKIMFSVIRRSTSSPWDINQRDILCKLC